MKLKSWKKLFFREEKKFFFRDANSIRRIACPNRDKRGRFLSDLISECQCIRRMMSMYSKNDVNVFEEWCYCINEWCQSIITLNKIVKSSI
jgi:hypothetical protein